jgi:hypothetical protein
MTISDLCTSFSSCAREVYHNWHQDEDGIDDELGEGGICDLIAESFLLEVGELGLDSYLMSKEGHTWVMVDTSKGLYHFDIPPHVYEECQGPARYLKVPHVKFHRELVEHWVGSLDELGK